MHKSLSQQFEELDYFTQRQIINEFPTVFLESHSIKGYDYNANNDPFEVKPINKRAILDRIGFVSLILCSILLGYAHYNGINIIFLLVGL